MNPPSESDFLTPKSGFLIVGLGASAGGIQALREFFEHVPAESNMAYVVILHLSPDHDSQLAQVLQTVSAIPVRQVTERVIIEPNHVYVVSPDQHLTMEDGAIVPSPNLRVEDRRAPVDIFFRSLADAHGPRAVSVVLSGTGANGSMGLKRVKEMGGVAYVQNPREAEFNEMPRNAIATELIDEVLPVAQIPGRIIAYRDRLGTVEIPVEAENRPEQQQQALREIFTHLRLRTGHDFSNYKRATLLRRIERRLNVRGLPDLSAYATYLLQNVEEGQALLKDLLISVTNFFRDKKPFTALEQDVLPAIFYNKKSDSEVRVWVAGCATGEEAYSLAMLLAERTWGVLDAPKVQIFATDIDESAIMTAREGLYTLNDAADVSPERLQRFFTKENDHYRVHREIREMVLFANHNFLKDPPFSRLDLVSCRNVLIYLNPTAQKRVMETFHFALKPGSYLFLGSAESVDGASELYVTLSRDNHLYQVRETSTRKFPVPESVPALLPRQPLPGPRKLTDAGSPPPANRYSFGELHQALLEQYAPPSLVVNEDYDIVHLSEKAGRFLEFSGGEPTKNLLKLVQPELRLELRLALYQAVQRQTALEARNITWTRNGERQSVTIHVRPVLKEGDTAKGFVLVIFEPGELAPEEQGEQQAVFTSHGPVAKQLEEELIQVKGQLRYSAEQFEYQAEELKASNEELQAMNEELRSAAEELETSKEELQSINEELRTVNQELKVKIEEISLTSNNFQNLINSAGVATIFLDRTFCIRLYTPAALQLFNLIPSDYGRPVSDITHRLVYDQLLPDAQTVLEKLTPLEREVTTTDQRTFMMQMLPYRTAEDRINGVVITLFDISARKHAEAALRQSEEQLRELAASLEGTVGRRTQALQGSRDLLQSVFDTNLIIMAVFRAVRDEAGTIQDFRIMSVNQEFARVTQRTDLVGRLHAQEYPGVRAVGIFDRMVQAVETGQPQVLECRYDHDGFDQWYANQFVKLDDGVVMTSLDITARKTTEQQLVGNLHLLEQAEAVAQLGSWDYDLATGQFLWSDGMYQLFGLPMGQPIAPLVYLDYVVDEDRPRAEQLVQQITTGVGDLEVTLRLRVGDEIKTVRIKSVVLRNAQDQAVRVLGVDLNLSELHRLEADNLRLQLGQQQALFAAVQAAEEEERRRMSESLHNGIGQLLYATKLQLDRLPDAPESSPRQEAARLLGDAIRQTRVLSHELTPAILEDYGLATTLQSMCSTLNGPDLAWGCHLNFEEGPALPMPLQLAVYRLAQELAQNVGKHAHATHATLEVDVLPAWVVLRVEDNGRGFDPARISDGLGLRSIRSRVALLGGSVHLTTAPDQGTQCQIRIPLPPPAP